jgi:hypothetical protein
VTLRDHKKLGILKMVLQSHFLKYNTFFLDGPACTEILESLEAKIGSEAPNTYAFRNFVRRSYKRLLWSLGRLMHSKRENRLLKDFPLLAVMKAWLVENNLVLGPFEGHYRFAHSSLKDMKVD